MTDQDFQEVRMNNSYALMRQVMAQTPYDDEWSTTYERLYVYGDIFVGEIDEVAEMQPQDVTDLIASVLADRAKREGNP